MSKNFYPKKTIFLFYIFIILFIVTSLYIFKAFDTTSKDIENLSLQSNVEYITNITSNIENLINQSTGDDLVSSLEHNKDLRDNLQSHLQLFVTQRYRYVYVVEKLPGSDEFRFLLDGAKEDKSKFKESFQPLNLEKWLEVYKTKKPLYFKHNQIKDLWLTYLRPIIKNNKVTAVIAIDFSLEEYKYVQRSLSDLSTTVKVFTSLLLVVFFIISIFTIIDKKRVYILKKQAQEIQNFNATLKQKIDEEVKKNSEKDKQIMEQSRLAQMGEMIGMIAHQWRQPINAISATSIVIDMKAQMGKLDKKTAVELAHKISELTQHLSKTIDDFRDFFKPTKEKNDITYERLVASTLEIVRVSIENKNIKIITDIQSDKVFHTYANELKQVLLNLIKNAEDILVEKKIENPYIKITAKGNMLSISDNGGGIPEDIIDKIFDPYFSTKTLNGTGLGLYMSKTIIETHCAGKLYVTNDEQGAVFIVELEEDENISD